MFREVFEPGDCWGGFFEKNAISFVFSAVLVIAGFAKSFHTGLQTATMMGSIFFMARAQVRWHLLRWILLTTGIVIDVILGATYIVDRIF